MVKKKKKRKEIWTKFGLFKGDMSFHYKTIYQHNISHSSVKEKTLLIPKAIVNVLEII